MAKVKQDQQTVFQDEKVVANDILQGTCAVLTGCFAAGTKLWTPEGYRNVEDIQPGEMVFARNRAPTGRPD